MDLRNGAPYKGSTTKILVSPPSLCNLFKEELTNVIVEIKSGHCKLFLAYLHTKTREPRIGARPDH